MQNSDQALNYTIQHDFVYYMYFLISQLLLTYDCDLTPFCILQ